MDELILHQMAKHLRATPDAKHSTFYRAHARMGYDLNREGFRCTEFDDRQDINVVTIGCSNALGWCVPIEKRYSKVFCDGVAENTGKSVADWNLGLPAKSNDYIARIAWTVMETLKPDIVLIGFTGISRREYWDCTGRCIDFVPSNVTNGVIKQKMPGDMHIHKKLALLQSEWDNVNNFLRNFRSIENTLKDIPWYYSFSSGQELGGNISESIEPLVSQDRYVDYFHVKDFAEDGQHPGVFSHFTLGKAILERYLNEFVSKPHVKRSNEVIGYL